MCVGALCCVPLLPLVGRAWQALTATLFGHMFHALGCVATTTIAAMNSPWRPQEVWLPLVLLFGTQRTMRACHALSCAVRAKIGRPHLEDYDGSVWSRLTPVVQSLGRAFAVLWAFDNFTAGLEAAGAAVNYAHPVVAGFSDAVYVVWATVVLLHLKRAATPALQRQLGIDQGRAEVVDRVLTVSLVGLSASMCMVCTDMALAAVGLAALSGLAACVALQPLLQNLLSGIALAILRPFSEGDVVVADGGKVEGIVIHAGWLVTKVLLSRDTACVTVPNSQMMRSAIANRSRRPCRYVEIKFVLPTPENPKTTTGIMRFVEAAVRQIPCVMRFDEPDTMPLGLPGEPRDPFFSPRIGVSRLLPEGVEITVQCVVGPVDSPSTGDALAQQAVSEILVTIQGVLQHEDLWIAAPIERRVYETVPTHMPLRQPANFPLS